ncbi:DUF4296 domain-containing protein [Sediminibacter sp. Hel_I_10]|uniref:DUF4296 domain-containing protein n=1 Tax=Sediminibacter sp. Hel_I_10 TaxID=1392490 RepID=UPI00047BBD32|nr:DUF4296 domain-containing protein [Sediminibacter sp. Hel_I_10]
MKVILYLMLIGLFLGCDNASRPKKPDDLISEDKMADILYEVFIINAAKGTAKGILEDNGIFPEQYVFEKYDIDSLQFAKSNAYYSYDIKTYDEIMSQVDTIIKINKDKYQAQIDLEMDLKKQKKDSIKQLSDSLSTFKKSKLIESIN